MRRPTLAVQLFLVIAVVAVLTTTLVAGYSHQALSAALTTTAAGIPMDNDADDTAFVESLVGLLGQMDTAVLAVTALALVSAGLASAFAARWLTRPLQELNTAVETFAAGDYDKRVQPSGPTEIAHLGEAFNRMADGLEEAEHLRRQLVADLAHELRNPVAAARAQAEAMADGVLPMDKIRVESLLDDLEHVTSLLNDLQELAIVESGRMHYHMVDFDMAELVQQQVKRVASRTGPNVSVLIKGATTPAMVRGDELRVAQVLRNIFANAKRHTVSGSITVSVQRAPEFVAVRVADTGEGIPPEALPHIFERFYRADASRSSDTGGAGLGLAISRGIIRDHGGEMFANSTLGRGTTIGFTIPRRPTRVEVDEE